MARILAATLVAMLIAVVAGPRFIAWLRDRGIGQTIRELSPERHAQKLGTPTMGGALILLAAAIPYLIFASKTVPSLVVFILAFGSGLIGFADDFMKFRRQRSLGLSGRRKLLLQLPLVLLMAFIAIRFGGVDTDLDIPLTDVDIPLSGFYYVFIFIFVAGFANAANLTDGLDGLAAGTVAVGLFVYAAIAFLMREPDLAVLAASLTGACVGFLWYNSFPADIFMGDTGSLALGAALAGIAMVTGTELLLVLIGGVLVVEALSVAIQVMSFRFFRRRVFLMTPVHHHFELKNWDEAKIIVRFWIAAAILAAAGFTLYYLDRQ